MSDELGDNFEVTQAQTVSSLTGYNKSLQPHQSEVHMNELMSGSEETILSDKPSFEEEQEDISISDTPAFEQEQEHVDFQKSAFENEQEYSVAGQLSTVLPSSAPWDTRANPTVENFLADQFQHMDVHVESRERLRTPEHLIEEDEILRGCRFMDWDDEHATIDQQAEDYVYKLTINRNPYIQLNAKLNSKQDMYDYDEINTAALLEKPRNFMIIGKPAVGSTLFAMKFARMMNLVYISPVSAVDYFHEKNDNAVWTSLNQTKSTQNEPGGHVANSGIDDSGVFKLIRERMIQLDVQHQGYILDGLPIFRSEELSVVDQLNMIRKLPSPPDILFIMQMQDKDLYKRRMDQKMDPLTGIVYTRKQYMRHHAVQREFVTSSRQELPNRLQQSKVSLSTGVTMSVTTISSTGLHDRDKTEDQRLKMIDEDEDFMPLQKDVVGRLISRIEDHPIQISRDLDSFKLAIPSLQHFINTMDRTRIFELDAYHSPKAIVKNALDIVEALGILPSVKLIEISHPLANLKTLLRPEDGIEGYSSGEEDAEGEDPPECVEDSGVKNDVDWAPILRAVVLIARVDPRFRWQISRWKNLCPVALKEGRSVCGNPQRAYGLYDKVYFLSTEEAVKKFVLNPRQYLIKDMPTSPVKFFVVGHPLAGKTLFANELAAISGGKVIDMKRQVRKCLESVKQRFLFKARFEATMKAKKDINRRNYDEWKRREKLRREKIQKWIADFIRRKAAEEINAALAVEREERMKQYRKMRWKSEYHELSASFKSSPCTPEPIAFSWKKFMEDIKRGVNAWSHQDKLELAWELYREGRLRYKNKSRKNGPRFRRVASESSDAEGYGLEQESNEESEGSEGDEIETAEEVGSGEELSGEGEEGSDVERKTSPKKRKHRKRRRGRCKKPAEIVVSSVEEEVSPLPSDTEPDEVLRLRYPEMCPELTESIPKPGDVEDQNEQVQAYVREKVEEAEKWVATLPSEIYEEILSIGIQDAERRFHQTSPNAHETGGWIVENMVQDVEKWRSILRNPRLCPDQVFVLQDTSENYSRISNRLKLLYTCSIANQNLRSRKITVRKKKHAGELWSGGEGDPLPEFDNADFDDLDGGENDSLSYALDKLGGQPCATSSEIDQILMDRRRQLSRVNSNDSITSEAWYESLGKERARDSDAVGVSAPVSIATSTTLNTVSTAAEDEECAPLWHSVVSQKELGLLPMQRSIPFEIKVVLPVAEAERRILVQEERWAEIEGETSDTPEQQELKEIKESLRQLHEASEDALKLVSSSEEEELIPTPSGLNTPINFDPDPESLCKPEDDTCKPPNQPLSLKKSFLKQVTAFDDFWNMIFPVLSAQKVGVFMVGIVNEDSGRSIARKFWEDLQRRFTLPPTQVSAGDLEEDQADVTESRALWSGKGEELRTGVEGSDFGESDAERENDLAGLYMSKLRGLEGNPDGYRNALKAIEDDQLFGEFKYYCPVTLSDHQYVRKGSPRYALRYQARLYYMANQEAFGRFLKNPSEFLPTAGQKCVPPPRICITGAPGCGQEHISVILRERSGIYMVDFRQRLQEFIKSRLGRDVGPLYTGEIVTSPESADGSEEESETPMLLSEDEGEEVLDEFDPKKEWLREKRERKRLEELALKSLTMSADKLAVDSFPIDSIERAETSAEKAAPPGRLTAKERHVKNYLETGTQLPPEVLNDFIPQLWKEEPFKSTGFILVGFPSTAKDVQYLCAKECIPEYVYVMECTKNTCRNRLIREAMTLWHRKENLDRNVGLVKKRGRATARENGSIGSGNPGAEFPIWCGEEKYCIRASRVLHHYYYICTKKLKAMKEQLNQKRIDWTTIQTDKSLFDAKAELVKLITPALKYRRNFFESTLVLYPDEAESLLRNHYFHLSKFSRWCPVEVSKGNQGINLWNAPGVIKYPVLYRNYIYFVAGEENLEAFRSQVLTLTGAAPPLPSTPVCVIVLGPPKAGKTELCKRLSTNLGLLYVSEEEVIGNILRHSMATDLAWGGMPVFEGPQPMVFAQKIHMYLKKGHSVPRYMFYRALDYALLHPLAQHHGIVFDNYPTENLSVQELTDRGIVPAVVINLDVDLETVLNRCESRRRIRNYNYEAFVEDCDDLMKLQYENYGPTTSPCIFWYGQRLQVMKCIDGKQNPAAIYEEASVETVRSQERAQRHMQNLIANRRKFPPHTLRPQKSKRAPTSGVSIKR